MNDADRHDQIETLTELKRVLDDEIGPRDTGRSRPAGKGRCRTPPRVLRPPAAPCRKLHRGDRDHGNGHRRRKRDS